MVGNSGTMVTMNIVCSKLQNRESSSAPVTTANTESQQQNYARRTKSSEYIHYDAARDKKTTKLSESDRNSASSSIEVETIAFTRTSGCCNIPNNWVFPPKAPSPNIYNCLNHDAMAASERIGFKGFKKQFSGRFKRLVSHKKDVTSPIPPELKPQLKTIYVY